MTLKGDDCGIYYRHCHVFAGWGRDGPPWKVHSYIAWLLAGVLCCLFDLLSNQVDSFRLFLRSSLVAVLLNKCLIPSVLHAE